MNMSFRLGDEPNTYYYDCTQLRAAGSYAYQWVDTNCGVDLVAICQFFPGKPTPEPPKPVLPLKSKVRQFSLSFFFQVRNRAKHLLL